MTDYTVRIDSGTTVSAFSAFSNWPDAMNDKIVYISDSSTLTLDTEIRCDALNVGKDSISLLNENGTLKLRADNAIKLKDINPLTIDPRIVWANDGSREINVSGTFKVEDLSGNENHGTRNTGVKQIGPLHLSNLQLYYDMQSIVPTGVDIGKMRDWSGNNRHGTINGTADIEGKFGKARQFFSLVLSNINGPDVDLALPFTLSAWVYSVGQGGVATGFIIHKGDNYRLKVSATGGDIIASYVDSGAVERTLTATGALSILNTWTHFTVTFVANATNTDVTIYRNGVVVAGPTTLTNQPTLDANTLRIGGISGDVNNFAGRIDDVSLFNTNLSAANIAILSHSGNTGYVWSHSTARIDIISDNVLKTKKITFLAWLNLNSSSVLSIAGKESGTSGWDIISIGASRLIRFELNGIQSGVGSARFVTSATSLTEGTWYHIACTYDGLKQRIYINGNLDAEIIYTNYSPIIQNNADLKIGGSNTTTSLTGYLDEIYIFNEALEKNEIVAYKDLTESAVGTHGIFVTETGTVESDTTDPLDLNYESIGYASFDSVSNNPKSRFPINIQGTGWSVSNFKISGHAPGFVLQTTESSLEENFLFQFLPETLISVSDTGGDRPLTTTTQRLGNVSRIKKIGYVPREVSFVVRLVLEDPSAITALRIFRKLASSSYKESHTFNVITDKDVIIGMQLTNFEELQVRRARWKIVDIEIRFTKRVI